MALLGEQLVDEWLNRIGFFTLRGVKSGVNEIDLLGIKPTSQGLEGWHVEVQVSFRPISYIAPLSKQAQQELGAKSATSSKKRSTEFIERVAQEWVHKKYRSELKVEMRNRCSPGIDWKLKFVHGRVYDDKELQCIKSLGIELIPFSDILSKLCQHQRGELFGGAGTDIAEMIRYYSETVAG